MVGSTTPLSGPPPPPSEATSPTQPSHVLLTKLFTPHPPPNLVSRPRLTTRVEVGLAGRLTLISAPAGFGKTTLVSEWVAGCGRPAAWLSLDEGDNDPVRFLTYLVAAVQTIAPHIGAAMLSMLQAPQPPPTEVILTALLNEVTSLPDPFLLVLDDYHVIDAHAVDQTLTFLLEHMPPQMRLVIATREDPPLPVARHRARGQLTELRAADLRFTPAEAAEFLNHAMGLNLSAEAIATLEDRTEGWIAGLQLAALSMQGRQDVAGFIRAFAGDHRYIVDYLVDEVLERQPEAVRRFLLQTAILDRLSGPLCDAILDEGRRTEDEELTEPSSSVFRPSSRLLEHLERANLFLMPLDDQRQWYRYHHLFADVLAARLRAEEPAQVRALHRRASAWYEQHGSATDAVRHALAAEDFERAAGLVERAWPAMLRSRQEALALGWLRALPDELLRCRPVLSAAYAATLLASGELEGVEVRLRAAERWLETPSGETRPEPGRRMVVVDEEAFRYLPGSIAVWRAGQALVLGDVANTVTYARRALDLVAEDDHLRRGQAATLLGLAAWTNGDLEAAHRTYAEGMARLEQVGHHSSAIGCAIALADIRLAQGRLRDAMRTYERGLQLATERGGPVLRGAADMYVGLSVLYREHNDLDAAAQHLLRSKELGEHMGLPQNPYRWRVSMARIRETEGDLVGAVALLDEAERLYAGDFFPNVRPVPAVRTRVWVKQGRLNEAIRWADEQSLSAQDALSYLREFEHITLARLLLAWSERDGVDATLREAVGLLDRLLGAAEAGGRMGSVIEILALQALAQRMQGDIPAALAPLERALTLAEPEGYVRMFVDEGQSMAELLTRLKDTVGQRPAYIRQLRAAFGKPEAVQPSAFSPQPLVEPLSEREHDVLRLLRTDLDGPDIARALVVSLSTVRTHTRNIYGKLGVNNRRAAVRRAEELNLF